VAERGGPPVKAPTRRGFGEGNAVGQLGLRFGRPSEGAQPRACLHPFIFWTDGFRPHCGCKSVAAFQAPRLGGFGAQQRAARHMIERPACNISNGFRYRLMNLLTSPDCRGVT
jgi:hypothetical protein